MPIPRFSGGTEPRAIVDESGMWLATELGWRWVKSRSSLEEREGLQVRELHLQPSTWNRTGVGTWVAPRVSLYDDRVREWRVANADLTVRRPQQGRYAAIAYTTLLVNIDSAYASVELSGLPQPDGSASLVALREAMVEEALPVLELFAEPASLADRLPERWLGMVDARTVEWLLATAGTDVAARLIQRYLGVAAASPSDQAKCQEAFRQGRAAAATSDGREQVRANSFAELGWLSRVHGLGEPLEF